MTTLTNKLTTYNSLNKGLIKPIKFEKINNNTWATKVFLAGVLPTLASVALQGQAGCQGPQATNFPVPQLPVNTSGSGLDIDVDGDMVNDFRIFDPGPAQLADLLIRPLNGGKVLTSGGSGTAKNFAAGATISGNAYNTFGGNNRWYLAFFYMGVMQGPWGPPYPTSGYIGVKQGGFYGFIQLTVNSGALTGMTGIPYNITVSEAGVGNNPVSALAGDCGSLLPVELIDFSTKVESTIQLNWATASETNNAGFEIERSLDGENFNRIGFVEGSGSSIIENHYSYEDLAAQKSKTYYYRLKQIDYDGRFEYSKVISATLSSGFKVGEAFPNPTNNGMVNLEFNSTAKGDWSVSIYDLTGHEISNRKITVESGSTIQEFDLTNLSQGVYFLKLENTSERIYRKITIH